MASVYWGDRTNINLLRMENNMPTVSVVLPTYNRESTIVRSVNSVLAQSYTDLELIVVDNGSTDRTHELLTAIEDKRMQVVLYDKERGACAARNAGIGMASGQFIAFQDSDDEWDKEKLQIQMNAFDADVDCVFCNAYRIFEGKGYGAKMVPERIPEFPSRDLLQSHSLVSTQTLIVRAKCLSEEHFDTKMPRLQDYDLVIRLAEKYRFRYVNRLLVNVYTQPDSISTDPAKAISACRRILEKYPQVMQNNRAAYKNMLIVIATTSRQMEEPDRDAEEKLIRLGMAPKNGLVHKMKTVCQLFIYGGINNVRQAFDIKRKLNKS